MMCLFWVTNYWMRMWALCCCVFLLITAVFQCFIVTNSSFFILDVYNLPSVYTIAFIQYTKKVSWYFKNSIHFTWILISLKKEMHLPVFVNIVFWSISLFLHSLHSMGNNTFLTCKIRIWKINATCTFFHC